MPLRPWYMEDKAVGTVTLATQPEVTRPEIGDRISFDGPDGPSFGRITDVQGGEQRGSWVLTIQPQEQRPRAV